MLDLLVLSPHLDDAALSCGGVIASTRRAGGRARIVTVFAGEEPRDLRSPAIDELLDLWGLEHGEVVAERRKEDESACRALGAECEHWDFLEAIYRRDRDDARALYSSLSALFLPDASTLREPDLVAELVRCMAELPEARRVLAPLGVGGHVDHCLVHEAASRRFGRGLRFYEEFPYSQWKWLAVWRATRPRRLWGSEISELTPDDVATRCRAIDCYASQLTALFGGSDRLEGNVRRAVRRVGGERCWSRRACGDL